MMKQLMPKGFMGAMKRDDGYWFAMEHEIQPGYYQVVFHSVSKDVFDEYEAIGKEAYAKYEALLGSLDLKSGTESEQSAENG